MIAYHYKEKTGEGQYIDVSMQHSLTLATSNAPANWELNRFLMKRAGLFWTGLSSPVRLKWTWQCLDGFVAFTLFGGTTGALTNRGIVEWMDNEGMANDFLKGVNWEKWDMAKVTQEMIDQIEEPISKFFMTHTKSPRILGKGRAP